MECGAERADLDEGVCRDCRVKGVTLARVPPVVDATVCAHCGSVEQGTRWVEGSQDTLTVVRQRAEAALVLVDGLVGARVRATVSERDPRTFTVAFDVQGTFLGEPSSASVATLVRVHRATCLRCSRIHGGYYEAVLQVRADGRHVRAAEKELVRRRAADMISRLAGSGDRDAFIMKEVEEHGGLDLYLGSNTSGRALAKALIEETGAALTETATLAGRRGGRDLVRMTFGLRLPRYFTGDLIVLDDVLHLVRGTRARTLALMRLADGAVVTVEKSRLGRYDVITSEELREATVVFEGPGDVQVLDPDSLRAVDLARPAWFVPGRKTVRVARHAGALHLVP